MRDEQAKTQAADKAAADKAAADKAAADKAAADKAAAEKAAAEKAAAEKAAADKAAAEQAERAAAEKRAAQAHKSMPEVKPASHAAPVEASPMLPAATPTQPLSATPVLTPAATMAAEQSPRRVDVRPVSMPVTPVTLQHPTAAGSVEAYLRQLEQLVLQLNMELGRRDQASSDPIQDLSQRVIDLNLENLALKEQLRQAIGSSS